MNRPSLALALALLAASHACAQTATPPLIVVADLGGASAQPYYDALNPKSLTAPAPSTRPPWRAAPLADPEAAMLPVRSVRLSPGDEPRRAIRAPGLTPIFLIGDDDRSRAWLRDRQATLRALGAVGLVVDIGSAEALASLRRRAPDLVLSPVSGDTLAERLGIRHYPVLITATGIEP